MQNKFLFSKSTITLLLTLMVPAVHAGTPLWSFSPLTATTISVPSNSTATIQYTITNQSNKTHTLVMQPIQGITQTTTGGGICSNPFVLAGHGSCTLSLEVNGGQIPSSISNGPIVCQQGTTNQCYRPSAANILQITQTVPVAEATITVSGSPLTLDVAGFPGTLTITNTSSTLTATNITSNFSGTALQGNVTESGNTCASVAPSASCSLTYTPGFSPVSLTSFTIQGSNTNALTAAIEIVSGLSDTDVTLTGTELTGTPQ